MDWSNGFLDLAIQAPAMGLLVIVVWMFLRHQKQSGHAIERIAQENHHTHLRLSNASDERAKMVTQAMTQNTQVLSDTTVHLVRLRDSNAELRSDLSHHHARLEQTLGLINRRIGEVTVETTNDGVAVQATDADPRGDSAGVESPRRDASAAGAEGGGSGVE